MSKNDITIGVDIGATKTQIGYVKDNRLRILHNYRTPTSPNEAVLELVKRIRYTSFGKHLKGIGIGCPGPLEQDSGIILSPPNLPEWKRFPLTEKASEQLRVPVMLENDANAGALGEALYGTGRHYNHVLYVTISTGFGMGIIIDKKIYRGFKGLAGEVWAFRPHCIIASGGEENINEICSGQGIVNRAKKEIAQGVQTTVSLENICTETICLANERGDELSVRLIEEARHVLLETIIFAITLIAPEIVILAGGLCTNPEWFIIPIQERIQEEIPIKELKDTPVKKAELWNTAVLYGAASLSTNQQGS